MTGAEHLNADSKTNGNGSPEGAGAAARIDDLVQSPVESMPVVTGDENTGEQIDAVRARLEGKQNVGGAGGDIEKGSGESKEALAELVPPWSEDLVGHFVESGKVANREQLIAAVDEYVGDKHYWREEGRKKFVKGSAITSGVSLVLAVGLVSLTQGATVAGIVAGGVVGGLGLAGLLGLGWAGLKAYDVLRTRADRKRQAAWLTTLPQ